MIASTEFEALFDEAGYLAKYPDVDRGVQAGAWSSGWHHFSRRGQYEGRTIDGFSLINYRRAVPPLTDEKIPPGQEPEPVRLIIWDLDDTFWKGTVTEGGIDQYVQEHHDIVIELAKRGIMSSICSKNDSETILKILEEKGILDYFIFPSISWESKGNRIQSIIESVQLRPATVMFIDDNPSNRAEAASLVPDLQIVDETFISKILTDPSFKGKDDSSLSRLAQYKLLETRTQDEKKASGNNEEFLRSCNIRVHIEYDVASHLDRAIELINRTNQLNYTKNRLPENMEEARRQLLEEIAPYGRQAGLVRVVDAYGDYGYVGFFVLQNWRAEHQPGVANRAFRHLCFSCRTLGMFVEQWLYNYLGQPYVPVVGEVLTDLSVPRNIDWIRLVPSLSEQTSKYEPIAPEIRLYGGCEANAVGVYLGAYTDKVEVLGNFSTGSLFVRVNSAAVALSAFERNGEEFSAEANILGLPLHFTARDYFADAPPDTAFVFSCAMDAERRVRYRHRERGWEFLLEPNNFPAIDFMAVGDKELRDTFEARNDLNDTFRERVYSIAQHIRANYESLTWESDDQVVAATRTLIERVPVGSKFVIVLDAEKVRTSTGTVIPAPWATQYNRLIKSLVKDYPYVATASFSEVIDSDDQIQIGGNHYDRMVYLRMAERLAETIRNLPARAADSPSAESSRLADSPSVESVGPADIPIPFRRVSAAQSENEAKPLRKMLSLIFGAKHHNR